jgi:hypothetical protein
VSSLNKPLIIQDSFFNERKLLDLSVTECSALETANELQLKPNKNPVYSEVVMVKRGEGE